MWRVPILAALAMTCSAASTSPLSFDAPRGFPVFADVLAVGDFNGDGKPDLAAAYYFFGTASATVSVLLGNGDGTFQPAVNYPLANGSTYVKFLVAVDLNGD